MALIGLVLLAAAAVFGIDVVAQNNFAIDVEGFGQVVSTSLAGLFVAGVVTGIVACVALMLMRDGAVRRRHKRAAARASAVERDRMAAAYEAEHGRRADDDDTIDLRERLRAYDTEPGMASADGSERHRVTTF